MDETVACYPSFIVSVLDQLSDLAPERVRPLKSVEFERLVSEGVFDDERVELLGGVIVEMSPQSTLHASAVMRLTKVLSRAAADLAEVRVQLPFVASEDSLPEPDIAVVPPGRYEDAHPDRALLLVEVAVESLRKDRLLKAGLYARAGVPEYWIVNVQERRIEQYTAPRNGAYTKLSSLAEGELIQVAGLAGAQISVADIIG